MQIYVINLDRAVGRLQHIQAQMHDLGLSFTRVPAIDARDLDYEQTVALHSKSDYCSWLLCENLGEAACNLSHAKALELIANGADEYGVVLEDDALLSKNAAQFLQDSSWIPANTKLLKIDTGSVKSNVLLEYSANITPDYALYKRLSTSYLAAGYIVSRQTARQLSQILQTTPFLVDALYYSFECGMAQELQVLQLYPAIIGHGRKMPSQIQHPKKRRGWNKNRFIYLYQRWRSYGGKNWHFGTHYRWGKVPLV
ncbi:glycosyltransferase family 25 protein [Bartonella sp. TP]|uniref:glycosyltransferase family 25 protein n=1 Tax=Bartonella sp. TP TaxID=3057550 RepID=UPI0025AFCFDE|nr:glycosyltransferase family 25 protein [Bartonella sp. TP]WJW80440.1 glycosyltransferase family 25 protein [Bartonella sp. TP]